MYGRPVVRGTRSGTVETIIKFMASGQEIRHLTAQHMTRDQSDLTAK